MRWQQLDDRRGAGGHPLGDEPPEVPAFVIGEMAEHGREHDGTGPLGKRLGHWTWVDGDPAAERRIERQPRVERSAHRLARLDRMDLRVGHRREEVRQPDPGARADVDDRAGRRIDPVEQLGQLEPGPLPVGRGQQLVELGGRGAVGIGRLDHRRRRRCRTCRGGDVLGERRDELDPPGVLLTGLPR